MGESVRSTMGIGLTEDTSLVMPSDKNQCTGQQRVLQQVKSIKRTKSKMVKDSLPSPTSPASATEYSEPKFQFSPTTAPVNLFSRSSTNTSRWQSRMTCHYTVRRQNGSITQSIRNGPIPVGSQNGNLSRARTVRTASQSQIVNHVRSKSDLSGMNGSKWEMNAMTLQEAVELLTHPDMYQQLCGASFIQHCTYVKGEARREVCQLGGIHTLIQLLKSENLDIQQTVSAALRNVVFKDSENKSTVKLYGGIKVILDLVQSNKDVEIQKQLTGLLWNLSSADDLKPDLNETGLEMLTKSILVPYTQPQRHTENLIEPEIFLNTTGCIRNLSCSSDEERICMRNCPNLIDSLVKYLQGRLELGELDDKSVENCVCILHNLSYKLDKEAPKHFSIIEDCSTQKAEARSKNSLFSTKIQKELSFPAMDTLNPEGVSWLYHRKTLQMYQFLLRLCQNESTLEACCGALQNLTASKNPVSTVMSQAIQKLNGLPILTSLLNSPNQNLQKTAMSVVGNMSRVSNLRAIMAKEALPHVLSFISHVDIKNVKADDTIATACSVIQTLAVAEPEHSKKLFKRAMIMNLSLLSENMSFSNARQPAGALLYSLWGQKDIYSRLKKNGMIKDTFVNTVTAASYKIISDKQFR
ncbi:plakophilin-1 [Triplophysa dalaica]|uniref:plakophilin-1 n=1 Tax=Triplophysa dalaica TaxID=1582913 RepID=UPI0024DF8EFA|nr:plakophilin-1 [Triplophysa dalaica]XP_056588590.1 plakophilin-1 [Triplophysa dalaica]